MQRCPKCGHYEGPDWPGILLILAFGLVAVIGGISGVKTVQLSIAVGMFLFCASIIWRAAREDKSRVEYLKSHPPAAERKADI